MTSRSGPALVVFETTAHEAALILSGKLDVDSLVAFEIVVEQLALTALRRYVSTCVPSPQWIGSACAL